MSPGSEFNAISDVHGSRTELATMASFFSQKNLCVCVGTDLAGMIREPRVGQLFCHHPTPWFFSVYVLPYTTNVFLYSEELSVVQKDACRWKAGV